MARSRKTRKTRASSITRRLGWVLLAVGLGAGNAGAVTPPEPTQRYLAPPLQNVATLPEHGQFRPAFTGEPYRPSPHLSGFRNRSISLLKYDTPLQVGQNDLIFKFRAPGARRTIVHFEFIFF